MEKLPESFVKRMRARLPQTEFEDFIAAYKEESLPTIRLNPQKTIPKFEDSKSVLWCSTGRFLSRKKRFITDPFWHAGAYYVQEASSMILENIFEQLYRGGSPQRALDLCAAPGGKSTLLQTLLNKDAVLVANEVIKSRVNILKENHLRWGISKNLILTQNDPKDFTVLKNCFDYIQVDAPCSGEGMFRKDPVALREWSPANTQLCSQRSHRILKDIIPALSHKGYLVYSTCTFNPEENEKLLSVVAREFELTSIPLTFPKEWGITPVCFHGIHGYYFYPHKVKGEGLFVAVLQKESGAPLLNPAKTKPQKPFSSPSLTQHSEIYEYKDRIFMKSPLLQGMERLLEHTLRIIYSGVDLGQLKGKNFIPSQALANFHEELHRFPKIEVDRETALQFLRGWDPGVKPKEKGVYLIAYQGLGLGFIKFLGKRSNNYYPKPWRIRHY